MCTVGCRTCVHCTVYSYTSGYSCCRHSHNVYTQVYIVQKVDICKSVLYFRASMLYVHVSHSPNKNNNRFRCCGPLVDPIVERIFICLKYWVAYSNIAANEPYSCDVIAYNSILLLHRRIANYTMQLCKKFTYSVLCCTPTCTTDDNN